MLIVDDDRHFYELARNLLEIHGARITTARSIGEGQLTSEHPEADAVRPKSRVEALPSVLIGILGT